MSRSARCWLCCVPLLLSACGGGGISEQGNGMLKDAATGLSWQQRDNGSDIDSAGARDYCAGLPGGWRLPSVDELMGLYDKSGKQTTPCGTFDGNPFTCNVSPLFRLSGPTPWSNAGVGTPEASIVGLSPARKGPGPMDGIDGGRALCVHGP